MFPFEYLQLAKGEEDVNSELQSAATFPPGIVVSDDFKIRIGDLKQRINYHRQMADITYSDVKMNHVKLRREINRQLIDLERGYNISSIPTFGVSQLIDAVRSVDLDTYRLAGASELIVGRSMVAIRNVFSYIGRIEEVTDREVTMFLIENRYVTLIREGTVVFVKDNIR